MAAYIDGCRNRFKVGPICRVPSEALARDVMDIHAGEFSAVYGYRKVWPMSSSARAGIPGKWAATR